MKILDIEIPDEMVSHTLQKTDWEVDGREVDGREVDPAWVGGRMAQINPVILKMFMLNTGPELKKADGYFVEHIKDLISMWPTDHVVVRQRMKADLLGALRTLHIIRGRLESEATPRKATGKKRIYQLDPITSEVVNVWEGVNAASRGARIPQGSISNAAHGRHETAGGFRWSFLPPDCGAREKVLSNLSLWGTLKDMMYDIFSGRFHPDEWDEVIPKMNKALNETLPPEYLITLEHALRLALDDARMAMILAKRHEQGEVIIAERTAEYEHVTQVFNHLTK